MTDKILSWNINGLRSQKTDIKIFIENLAATIICFQETKVTRDMLEEALAIVEGYSSYFSFSKKRSGYSGVATYCKNSATPVSAQDGLSGRNGDCVPGGSVECLGGEWEDGVLRNLDTEGRCIITLHRIKVKNDDVLCLAIINVYCPRADPEKPERTIFKLQFYELLRQRAESLRKAGSHVIIVGDVNTSHKIIDHCDPEDLENFDSRADRIFLSDFFHNIDEKSAPIHTSNQKSNVSATLNSSLDEDNIDFHSDFRMIDTFRHFHSDRKDAFTCWNTQVNARATNYGTRIDYALCNSEFISFVSDSEIHPDIEGSDHCPVSLMLSDEVEFMQSEKCPPVCTKYFPEFKGNQQKLQNYFKQEGKHPEKSNCPDNKRKQNSNIKSAPKQTKLSSFFDVNTKKVSIEVSKNNESDILKPLKVFSNTSDNKTLNESRNSKPAANWNFLFKKPKPPPVCSGHKEPSILRTVKKKGPNFNRQFFACSKGAGRSNDPNAQCAFFQWS